MFHLQVWSAIENVQSKSNNLTFTARSFLTLDFYCLLLKTWKSFFCACRKSIHDIKINVELWSQSSIYLKGQLNVSISNIDISNTTSISRYVCGPGHFYYINDLKKNPVCRTRNSRIPRLSRSKFMAQITKRHALSRSQVN